MTNTGVCGDTLVRSEDMTNSVVETMLGAHPAVIAYHPVGSWCVIGVDDPRDKDYLVLIFGRTIEEAKNMFPGWSTCGTDFSGGINKGSHWFSVRRGEYNLIVTTDLEWYEGGRRAQRVCEALRVSNKMQRIIVWNIVRDGLDAVAAAGLASNSIARETA